MSAWRYPALLLLLLGVGMNLSASRALAAQAPEPQVRPKPGQHLREAKLALRRGDLKAAESEVRQELRYYSTSIGAIFLFAGIREQQKRPDSATGYYREVIRLAREMDVSGETKRQVQTSQQRLRKIDPMKTKFASIRRDLVRELTTLGKMLIRKKEDRLAVNTYASLARVTPEDDKVTALVHDLQEAALTPDEMPTERGYTSIINGFDFTGWTVPGGYWSVNRDHTLNGRSGLLRYDKRLKNFRLKMTYRVKITNIAKQIPPVLWIHRDGNRRSGARIQLFGVNAGLCDNMPGDKKYVKTDGEVKELIRTGNYIDNDWNEIEVTVKGHSIKVSLNGKSVYRSKSKAQVEGYGAKFVRNFPGQIQLHAIRAPFIVKSVSLKK